MVLSYPEIVLRLYYINIINSRIDNLAISLLDMIAETPDLEPSDQLKDAPEAAPEQKNNIIADLPGQEDQEATNAQEHKQQLPLNATPTR